MRHPPVLLLVAWLSPSLLTSCLGHSCTELGCIGTLEVQLDRSEWPDGAYTVMITLDETSAACSFSLPLLGDGDECNRHPIALDGTSIVIEIDAIGEGNADEVVRIEVDHEGDLLADEDAVIQWGPTSYPNGPSCEPACASGSASLAL